MPILGLDFKNIIVIFETSVLEFVLVQSLMETPKPLNSRPKMPNLGTFGLKVETYFVIFEISTIEFL